MDYENIDVTDMLGGGEGEEKEGLGEGEGGGRKGHWGYGGTEGQASEADVFAVDEDDEEEEAVDLEHELPAFASAANRDLNEQVKATEKVRSSCRCCILQQGRRE